MPITGRSLEIASSTSLTDFLRPTSMGMIEPGNNTELRSGRMEMISGTSTGPSGVGFFAAMTRSYTGNRHPSSGRSLRSLGGRGLLAPPTGPPHCSGKVSRPDRAGPPELERRRFSEFRRRLIDLARLLFGDGLGLGGEGVDGGAVAGGGGDGGVADVALDGVVGKDLDLDLVRHLGMITQVLLGVLTPLADAVALEAEPGARLLDHAALGAQIDQVALVADPLAVQDVELHLAERRSHLVLHHLDACTVANHLLAVLHGAHPADVQADAGVELQRVAAGGGLRVAEHDAD